MLTCYNLKMVLSLLNMFPYKKIHLKFVQLCEKIKIKFNPGKLYDVVKS